MRKETFKAAEYLRKLIADYDKADKDWNVVDFAERYANKRVLEELHNLYNEEEERNDCISKELIYQRIKELKQDYEN
tara:strand:+ start:892 stop:1122 length:231 start_codon:yes stop_codon:yes gene_type:complete